MEWFALRSNTTRVVLLCSISRRASTAVLVSEQDWRSKARERKRGRGRGREGGGEGGREGGRKEGREEGKEGGKEGRREGGRVSHHPKVHTEKYIMQTFNPQVILECIR